MSEWGRKRDMGEPTEQFKAAPVGVTMDKPTPQDWKRIQHAIFDLSKRVDAAQLADLRARAEVAEADLAYYHANVSDLLRRAETAEAERDARWTDEEVHEVLMDAVWECGEDTARQQSVADALLREMKTRREQKSQTVKGKHDETGQ